MQVERGDDKITERYSWEHAVVGRCRHMEEREVVYDTPGEEQQKYASQYVPEELASTDAACHPGRRGEHCGRPTNRTNVGKTRSVEVKPFQLACTNCENGAGPV